MLQTLEGHEPAGLRMDAHVLLQALDEEDLVEADPLHLAVDLHGEKIGLGRCCIARSDPAASQLLTGLVHRLQEAFEGKGFEQVVHGIEVECLRRELRIGRREDGRRRARQSAQQLVSAQGRHLDVEEK